MADLTDLKSVYLIYGSEDLLLERAVGRLRDRLAKVADLDFNFDHFDGSTATADEIVAAANTLPFMSERRLVVVRDVDRMSADEQSKLAEYVKDPAEHTCLVLVATKIAKNTRLYKAASAAGAVSEYAAPKRSEYPAAVVSLFKEKGRSVGTDAARLLVDAIGTDLRKLSSEVDKIVAYAGDAKKLTADDVRAVIVAAAPTSIFEFLDAVGSRDTRRALSLLADLQADGESLLGIHSMTMRHLRQLISVKALTERGMDQAEIARAAGMADWQVRNVARQAARFQPRELVDALRAAAGVEAQMKSSTTGETAFQRWLIELTAARAA